MNKWRLTLVGLFLFSLSSLSFANSGEDELGYESLINELSKTRKTYQPYSDPLSQVQIHFGVSFISSATRIAQDLDIPVYQEVYDEQSDTPELKPVGSQSITEKFTALSSGIQVTLGIDLFSRHWLAEGTVRNFGESLHRNRTISLQEFDLKFLYQNLVYDRIRVRGGFGLAARYLDIENHTYKTSHQYSTPSSILFLGAESDVSDFLSFGAEVSRRTSLVAETADKSAIDLAFRIDTHF